MPTSLDPVPQTMRTCFGFVVVNKRELEELAANNGDTFKLLAGIVGAADAGDALLVLQPKIKKRKQKLPPSTRLFMVHIGNLARKKV